MDHEHDAALAGDILHGAAEIARFVFGSADFRRKVYGLIQRDTLPHFRIGKGLCARKSVLLRWIGGQENSGSAIPLHAPR